MKKPGREWNYFFRDRFLSLILGNQRPERSTYNAKVLNKAPVTRVFLL